MRKHQHFHQQALFLFWPLSFSLGIAFARWCYLSVFTLVFFCGLLLFFALIKYGNYGLKFAIAILFFALGGLTYHLQYRPIKPIDHMGSYMDEFAQIMDIQPLQQGQRYLLQRSPDAIEYIRVTTKYHQPEVQICDQVSARSFLIPPNTGYVPLGFNLEQYSKLKRIAAYGSLQEPLMVVNQSGANIRCLINKIRYGFYKKLTQYFDPSNLGVASALLLGYRSQIRDTLNTRFKHLGISHMLAISGLHMALVAGFAFGVFRFILCLSQRISLNINVKKVAALLSIPIIIFYCLIAGMQASTIRAAIMAIVAMGAIVLDRPILSFRTFSYALFLILFFMPEQLYSTGFQLSFLAVLGLISLTYRWEYQSIFRRYILITFFLMVWLIPVNFYYFGYVSLLSFLANALLIPLLSFVLMPLLLLGFIFAPIWKIADMVLSAVQYGIKHTDEIIVILSQVKPDLWVILLYYFVFSLILLLLHLWKKQVIFITLLLLFLFGHLSIKKEIIHHDILIYKYGQIFWMEDNNLHTNIPKGKGVSTYITGQIKQYYGIHPKAEIIKHYNQGVTIKGKRIQNITQENMLDAACVSSWIVLAPANESFTCLKGSFALILSMPSYAHFYHIRMDSNSEAIAYLEYVKP